jgi:serine phosphatase RsbU (regulator of sigma subunit)
VGSDSRRSSISAAIFAVIVIALLISGGLYVRALITQAFQTANNLAATRALSYDTLRYMLDEETGVRGYAATHDRFFLDPYLRGKSVLRPTIANLRAKLPGLNLSEATPYVDDLLSIDQRYIDDIAEPLINDPKANTNALERLGKARVDRFRSDVRRINDVIDQREARVNGSVRDAIDHIGILVGAAVILVLMISLLFSTQQASLAARVEAERLRTAEERREADILRSAYLTEKRIADTLQEAFVQRPLPTHPTFRFSATYVPASEEAKVGGDWYDALEMPGNRVLFAIGDVTGHGIEAAVTMNRVRQTLVSSALFDPTPAALLQRVAKELYTDKAPLVTAVAGYADASTYEFVYATAGHPPPLLIEPGRPPRMLDCGSLPLGAMPDNEYQTFRIQTVPGAMLVLYTDGAIEHSRDVIEGETILLAAAAEAARLEPPDPATFIHNAVFSGREIGDDVAILTIGFAAEPAVGVRVSADSAQTAFSGRLVSSPAETRPAGKPQAAWRFSQFGKKVA